MYIFKFESLEKAYPEILNKVIKEGNKVNQRGIDVLELAQAVITINNPRKRVIGHPERKLDYGLIAGELLWILQGRSDVDSISNYDSKYIDYSDDGVTLNGAYGQRIFRWEGLYDVIDESYTDEDGNSHPSFSLEHIQVNQFEKAFELLKTDQFTNQAIISIYNPVQDTSDTKNKPCTNTIQFTIRDGKLNMTVYMSNNDAWARLPYDTFNFMIIQEIMAGRLGIDIGKYTQFVDSLYINEEYLTKAKRLVKTKYEPIYDNFDSMTIQDARLDTSKLDEEMMNVYNVEATTRTMAGIIQLEAVEKMLYKIKNLYWRSIAAIVAVYNFKKAKRSEDEIKILKNYIGNEFNIF